MIFELQQINAQHNFGTPRIGRPKPIEVFLSQAIGLPTPARLSCELPLFAAVETFYLHLHTACFKAVSTFIMQDLSYYSTVPHAVSIPYFPPMRLQCLFTTPQTPDLTRPMICSPPLTKWLVNDLIGQLAFLATLPQNIQTRGSDFLALGNWAKSFERFLILLRVTPTLLLSMLIFS